MEDELIKKIWDDVLVILKEKIVAITYDTWILPLIPHSFEDNCFCALTGQNLAVQLLQKNQKEISEALSQVCGKEVYFKVVYDEEVHKQYEKEKQKLKKEEQKEFIQNLEKKMPTSKYDGLKQMQSDCRLNLKYRFENFVVGANNKFAHAVAQAVAKDPGKQYNPLFIYGGSGLGKTHLLQAIGHDILFHKPKLKVKYIKAEEFINDLVNSIAKGMDKVGDKNKKMNEFRNKYRNADVLLIDDIQLIEGKARTEEKVFIVEGLRMFVEVPKERVEKVYISETLYNRKKLDLNLQNFPVEILSDSVFQHVSDTKTPQGILCVVRQEKHILEELLSVPNPHFVVLDNLQDPGNLGTIVRTAEGAGVDAVFMSRDCVDIYNPKTIRSTMGSIYRMPILYVEDIIMLLDEFRKKGICSYAAHLEGKHSYDEENYCGGTAILIGNEGNGLREEVSAKADIWVQIPMQGQVESLNAAIAAAVLMFEVSRQRRQ